jgi:hypothetical protein
MNFEHGGLAFNHREVDGVRAGLALYWAAGTACGPQNAVRAPTTNAGLLVLIHCRLPNGKFLNALWLCYWKGEGLQLLGSGWQTAEQLSYLPPLPAERPSSS